MSKYFVNDPPVGIYEFEPGGQVDEAGQQLQPNVIYIRPRMDLQTRGRFQNLVLQARSAVGQPAGMSIEYRPGDQDLALLQCNIVSWAGPDFDGVPLTPDTIGNLDPNSEHIARVLVEIARRNRPAPSPNPKQPAGGPSLKNGLGPSARGQLAERAAQRTQAAPPARSGIGIDTSDSH